MTDPVESPIVSQEGKSAAREFLNNFSEFKDTMSKTITDMGTRLEALDRKSTAVRRPALAAAAEETAPHQKAFQAYVRRGDDDALRSLAMESKGLNSSVEAEGGYLVDPQTAESIASVMRSGASLRSLANVVQVNSGTYDVLIDHNEIGFEWMAESGSVSETTSPVVDRISIPLHELSASPAASQRILDDSAFDIESWLAGRIGDRFLRAESAAFVNGNGNNQPKGLLDQTIARNTNWEWGELGYIITGTDGGFDPNDPADALIDLIYALNAEYRAGAAFIMNSKTAGEIRKMKDTHGRFLWMEGLQAEQPPLIAGYPVLIVEEMPDIGNNSYSVAFGNFRAGYTIAERPELRILRDPYTSKPNVIFYATKRVGGDVTDFAAIKLLRFGNT